MKRWALRPRAEVALIEVTQWYAQQEGLCLGERFFDEAQAAAARIAEPLDPGLGQV